MTDHQEIPLTETHHCSCGESDTELPELDVRTIPHAIRHGAVSYTHLTLPTKA